LTGGSISIDGVDIAEADTEQTRYHIQFPLEWPGNFLKLKNEKQNRVIKLRIFRYFKLNNTNIYVCKKVHHGDFRRRSWLAQ